MCTLSIFMELLFAVLSEVSYGCFNECTFIVLFWVCFFSYSVITGVLVAHVQDKFSPYITAFTSFISLSSQVKEEARLEVAHSTVAVSFQRSSPCPATS